MRIQNKVAMKNECHESLCVLFHGRMSCWVIIIAKQRMAGSQSSRQDTLILPSITSQKLHPQGPSRLRHQVSCTCDEWQRGPSGSRVMLDPCSLAVPFTRFFAMGTPYTQKGIISLPTDRILSVLLLLHGRKWVERCIIHDTLYPFHVDLPNVDLPCLFVWRPIYSLSLIPSLLAAACISMHIHGPTMYIRRGPYGVLQGLYRVLKATGP
ncbi:hypothetical protein J3F84DRAFT_32126 [Trichoderma pleuroticola]